MSHVNMALTENHKAGNESNKRLLSPDKLTTSFSYFHFSISCALIFTVVHTQRWYTHCEDYSLHTI